MLSFDLDLALVYLMIMLTDYIWYRSDNFISFPISRGVNTTQKILEGLAALGIFLTISTVLVSTFSPQSIAGTGIVAGAQSIFQLLAASTPILQGSAFFTFIGWGILVPIIETSFFNGRLLEGLATYAETLTGRKISLDKFSTNLFMVMFVAATAFTMFHITAKGLDSIPLLITFIFSIISSILVIRQRDLTGAITLHIFVNSAAVASSLGFF